MKEDEIENSEEQEENWEKTDEKLPFCNTAPSAEHARADDDDGPCDDGRAGDIGED